MADLPDRRGDRHLRPRLQLRPVRCHVPCTPGLASHRQRAAVCGGGSAHGEQYEPHQQGLRRHHRGDECRHGAGGHGTSSRAFHLRRGRVFRPDARQLCEPRRRQRDPDHRQRLRASGHRDLRLRRTGARLRLHGAKRRARRHHAANGDRERHHGGRQGLRRQPRCRRRRWHPEQPGAGADARVDGRQRPVRHRQRRHGQAGDRHRRARRRQRAGLELSARRRHVHQQGGHHAATPDPDRRLRRRQGLRRHADGDLHRRQPLQPRRRRDAGTWRFPAACSTMPTPASASR